jgi:hypothetical protein
MTSQPHPLRGIVDRRNQSAKNWKTREDECGAKRAEAAEVAQGCANATRRQCVLFSAATEARLWRALTNT